MGGSGDPFRELNLADDPCVEEEEVDPTCVGRSNPAPASASSFSSFKKYCWNSSISLVEAVSRRLRSSVILSLRRLSRSSTWKGGTETFSMRSSNCRPLVGAWRSYGRRTATSEHSRILFRGRVQGLGRALFPIRRRGITIYRVMIPPMQ